VNESKCGGKEKLFDRGISIQILYDDKDAAYISVNRSVFVNKKLTYCQDIVLSCLVLQDNRETCWGIMAMGL